MPDVKQTPHDKQIDDKGKNADAHHSPLGLLDEHCLRLEVLTLITFTCSVFQLMTMAMDISAIGGQMSVVVMVCFYGLLAGARLIGRETGLLCSCCSRSSFLEFVVMTLMSVVLFSVISS